MFAETRDVCAACLKFENDIKQKTVELDMQVQLCYIVEQYFVSVLIINVLYRKMVKIIKMDGKKYFWPSKQKTCKYQKRYVVIIPTPYAGPSNFIVYHLWLMSMFVIPKF